MSRDVISRNFGAYGKCSARGENRLLIEVTAVIMMVIAGLFAAAVLDAEPSYAAAEKVTVGKFDGGSVKKVDSIKMADVDLSTVKDGAKSTYRIAIQFEKNHDFYYDSMSIWDQTPAGGTFSCGYPTNYPNAKQVAFDVYFDPTWLTAGIYTGTVCVPLKSKVNANGGVYECKKDEDGDGYKLLIPISITLKGSNPRFLPPVKTLSAEAWNGSVEIRWTSPDDEYETFDIFRREGKDSSPSKPELDKYKFLGAVNVKEQDSWSDEPGADDTVFADYYAKNGKTYSYIVMSSGTGKTPYSGNPSKSVTATPKASLRKKPAAPFYVGLKSADDGIGLTWNWDEVSGKYDPDNYGRDPQNETGEGEVDHFNIYQNGRLVKQVPQSAIKLTEYNDHVYGTWETRIKTNEFNVPFTFYATAVSADGTESIPSKRVTGIREEEKDIEIWSCHLFYTTEEVRDRETDKVIEKYTGFDIELSAAQNVDYLKVWRKAAGAPDSDYAKVDLIDTPEKKVMDTGVKKGKCYTYKIIAVISDGQESDPIIVNVAAEEGDWQGAPGGHQIDINFRTTDGKAAMIRWSAYEDGTYKLYRDGKAVKSWKNPDKQLEYADNPGVDGRYEYYVTWTSAKYPEVSITSNKVTFIRDTSDPDPDSFDKAPGKPKLTGRVLGYSESNWLQLMWTPSKEGGTADGFVIYRTDGGIPNTSDWENSLSWGNPKRNDGEAANGRFWCTKGDVDRYQIFDFSNDNYGGTSGNNPHKIWIVPYNEVGYGEPSNVLEYVSDEDGLLSWDTDDSAPEAPENVTAWTEWKPDINYPLDLSGTLNITWGAPSVGGDVDHYDVEVYHPGFEEKNGDHSITVKENTEKRSYEVGSEQKCEITLWDYYVGLPFTVTVTAVNTKGEASASPVTTVITSIPSLKAEAIDKDAVKLSWKGLLGSEKGTEKEFRFFRRANSSKWKKIKTIPYGEPGSGDDWTYDDYYGYEYTDTGLEGSTTYEYYVSAIDKDGNSHNSKVWSATLNNMNAKLDAPKNLKAKNVNGDVILSWTPSDAGGLPAYYRLEYQLASEDPEEGWWYTEDLDDSFGLSTGGVVSAMEHNSYNDQLSNMITEYGGKKMRLRVKAIPARGYSLDWSEPSNMIEFTWPTEDQVKKEKYPPEPITPEAEAGDGKVTLRWKKRTKLDKEESEASYYQVLRTWGSNYGVVATFPADKDSYEWVDTDVVNGEKYTYELRPCSSYYYSYYSTKWWYHPWCYMHQVQVIPNGKTTDQKIAENIKAFADELLAERPASPEDITVEYHDKVMELQESYVQTTAYQRRLIGKDKCAGIEDLINEVLYHDSEKKYAEDARLTAALDAIDALDNYPADIGLDDQNFSDYEKAVKAARNAYEDLPDDAKKLVSNLDKLSAHEAHIKKLRRDAANKEKADDLSDRMEELKPESITPETLTDELEREIRDLRYEYDSMTKAQKELVREHALSNLEEAEEKAGMERPADDPSGDDPSGDDPSGDDPPAEGAYMKLTPDSYKWNGKLKTPAVTVFYNGEPVDPSDYILMMPPGRKNVGVYTVSALLIGENEGTAKADFTIKPKGTSISKVKSAKKAFTVKWKKQKAKMSKARVTGYQIQYSTDKKFKKNSKTIKVKGWMKTSRKISGLKAKKTYYVRIRTYMKTGGKTISSAWSKKKKVKTK